MGDAPSCHTWGAFMVRNGSCYRCMSCGSTSPMRRSSVKLPCLLVVDACNEPRGGSLLLTFNVRDDRMIRLECRRRRRVTTGRHRKPSNRALLSGKSARTS